MIMENSKFASKKILKAIFIAVIVLQVIAALYFCEKKQGTHYDEKYSYYSSNVTNGLHPSDGEWMSGEDIRREFYVSDGYEFNYKMVNLMQTYDVHPPLYYNVLHTVCSLTPGIYSKWQGLLVNIIFFVLSLIILGRIADILGGKNPYITLITMALFGFSPAIYSGVTFIRMYMMLTFLCLLSFLIHLKALEKDEVISAKFLIYMVATTYLGFLTHYYFIVFLFFEAAYMSLYLLFKQKKIKASFIYGGCVTGGLLLAVISYPASLRHIFRGYRGTEAIGSFFDLGNLKDRAGLFIGLLQEYLLCNTFYILLLVLLVLYVSYGYIKKTKNFILSKEMIFLVAVVLGYFLVVLKTALMNYEEAVRYEMPVYGLMILLITSGIVGLLTELLPNRGKTISICIFTMVLVFQFVGLASDKVLFIYPEERKEREFADIHSKEDIIYIYNHTNQWMIWDNAEELSEYDKIYFMEMNSAENLSDESLLNSNRIYAYVMRYEAADERLEKVIESNPNITNATLIEKRLYADIYELR